MFNSIFKANTALPLVEDCEERQSMLTAAERVIIQTALIKAMDRDQSKSEITSVLMNTSSQRTYITEEIVKKFKLTRQGNVKLTVFKFGASKRKEITTPIATALLKSKKRTVSIKVSVGSRRLVETFNAHQLKSKTHFKSLRNMGSQQGDGRLPKNENMNVFAKKDGQNLGKINRTNFIFT